MGNWGTSPKKKSTSRIKIVLTKHGELLLKIWLSNNQKTSLSILTVMFHSNCLENLFDCREYKRDIYNCH